MKKVFSFVLGLFLITGCASLKWWENPEQYTVQDNFSAVGEAKNPGDMAKSKLEAEAKARDRLAQIMREKVTQFENAWKEKSKLYSPFGEKEFVNGFIDTERTGASVQASSDDPGTGTVRCLVVRSLEQFYGQLRTQGMTHVAKARALGKQEEIEWDITCKGIISDMIAKHNQTANLKAVEGGVEKKE